MQPLLLIPFIEFVAQGEEMSVNGMRELEEMAVKLEATARKLPQGPGRDELLRDIASFRAKLAARPLGEGLKVEGQ
jgi:hypothetical protein